MWNNPDLSRNNGAGGRHWADSEQAANLDAGSDFMFALSFSLSRRRSVFVMFLSILFAFVNLISEFMVSSFVSFQRTLTCRVFCLFSRGEPVRTRPILVSEIKPNTHSCYAIAEYPGDTERQLGIGRRGDSESVK